MTLVIGTDEAGYGPNLGPLVVAGTAWRIAGPPEVAAEQAEVMLSAAVTAGLAATRPGGGPLWDDSKRIYRPGHGCAALEHGVLTGLVLATGSVPSGWPALLAALAATEPPTGPPPERAELAALALPRDADPAACLGESADLRRHLERCGVTLLGMACRILHPAEFNALLGEGLNKSDILSQVTLELAAALRAASADEPAIIWCDRHGGRKHYGGLVSRHFEAPLVRAIEETATRSAYLVASPACRVEFCVGGESRVPVALASMTAKYVRELAMQSFNAFWSARMPGLRPTAGYPVDAGRWRNDAAAAIRSLGIGADLVWRRV